MCQRTLDILPLDVTRAGLYALKAITNGTTTTSKHHKF